jgi:hypothetical protein
MAYSIKNKTAANKSKAAVKGWVVLSTGVFAPVEHHYEFLSGRAQRVDLCRERSVDIPVSRSHTCFDWGSTDRSKRRRPALALLTPGVEEGILALNNRILSLKRQSNWAGKGSKGISQAACIAAISFVSDACATIQNLPLPRVGPSVLGGVALQWDFGQVHFMVRIDSDLSHIHFQEEGPGFRQSDGVMEGLDVIQRLRDLAKT